MISFYDSPGQKRQLLIDARSRNESQINDDFIDRNGIPTDGRSGRLTTGIKADPIPRVIKTHDELLLAFYKKRIDYQDLLDLLVMEHLTDHATKWTKFKRLFNP